MGYEDEDEFDGGAYADYLYEKEMADEAEFQYHLSLERKGIRVPEFEREAEIEDKETRQRGF